MYNSLPLGLLRFCIEHSDDPGNIANLDMSRFERDQNDYKWLIEALGDLESDAGKALRILESLRKGTLTEYELIEALETLQYLVEDLDVSKGTKQLISPF